MIRRLTDYRSPTARPETPAARAVAHIQDARRLMELLTSDEQAYVAEMARELLKDVDAYGWAAFAAELEGR